MSKLLTDALADAKAVKATAYANAKAAIEEAFQPSLQRMISAKLSEEDEFETDEEVPMEEPAMDDTGFGSFEDELSMDAAPEEGEDDVELEQLMRELDGMEDEEEISMESDEFEMDDEMTMEGEEEDWQDPIPDEVTEMDDVTDDEIREMIMRELNDGGGSYEETAPDRDVNTESTEGGGSYEDDVTIRSVNSENRRLRNEVKQLKKQKNEALMVVSKLKTTINEVNLLNAKLLYTSKVMRQFELDKKQKTTVVESLDRAKNVHGVKLVYTTICETLNKTTSLKKRMTEGYASKAAPTIKPKQNLQENNMVARWQELANIKTK